MDITQKQISEMTDEEKSLLLAIVMQLETSSNLYLPENMSIAWRVLNEAGGFLPDIKPINDIMLGTKATNHLYSWYVPPSKIQRLWLDKVAELLMDAITTGTLIEGYGSSSIEEALQNLCTEIGGRSKE